MKVEKRDGIAVLITEEKLDVLDAPKLREAVEKLAQEDCLKIVIDMERTRFLDSTGCVELFWCLKTLLKNHGDMKIAKPTPKILKILQLTRLHRVFEIYDSVESAVESLS